MTSSSPEKTPDLGQAWHHAVAALSLAAPPDAARHPGVGGRTLSGPVVCANGDPAWLRVESAMKPGGRLWEGNILAESSLPFDIPRPRLLANHAWGESPTFQALLFSRIESVPVSSTPDLRRPLAIKTQWWSELHTALHQLQETTPPENRRSHTPGFIERIPNYLPEITAAGVDLTVRTWVTSHADLHWANVTHTPLVLLDWEGWGAAPLGYDAAVLHAYALAEPEAAAKVREVFAGVLDTEDGRLAHLIICAEIIQAAERDMMHSRLAPYARQFALQLLSASK